MVEAVAARHRYGHYASWTLFWKEWEMPFRFLALLEPMSLYVVLRLMYNAGLQLWLLVVTKWTASVAVFLVWKAHNTCRLSYFPPRVLYDLKIVFLQSSLGAIVNQDRQPYLARTERTN